MWILTEREMNKVVAAKVAQHSKLWKYAEGVKAGILTEAAAHNKTGAYISSIEVRPRNRVDVEVVATDPAAAHIEWGHELSGDYGADEDIPGTESSGSNLGRRHGTRWVNGLHIVRNGSARAGATPF